MNNAIGSNLQDYGNKVSAAREFEVDTQIARQAVAFDALHSAASQLVQALACVSRSSPPTGETAGAPKPVCATRIGQQIQGGVDRLNEITDMLLDAHRRLEVSGK